MSPLLLHRRSRRRSWSGVVITVVCVLIVAALLVGGVARIALRSGSYDADLNRSFATQGAVVVAESNATAAAVRRLMGDMPELDRRSLQAELDTLVDQTGQQAASAAPLEAPASAGDAQGRFATVFSYRAEGVKQLRAAIDGLLGMHPLPQAGAVTSSGTSAATPTLLSASEATNRIAAAGTLLVRSDRMYQSVRRTLPHLAGRATLPSSTWISSPHEWQIGSLATQINLLSTSTSLAVTHRLVLRAVQLSPPALPPPTGVATPSVSILSPTTTVALTVVLSNLGSVDEPHASVQFSLAALPGGAALTLTKRVGLAAGGSVTVSPVSFSVKPGHDYRITVAIVDLTAQTNLIGTAVSQELQIAPNT